MPETIDWSDAASLFALEYIRLNYELVTSIQENTFSSVHEIRIAGNDISKIFSSPANGYVFVKNTDDDSLRGFF